MGVLGKTIRLKGITQKGKNRVREHGEMWSVLAETDRVIFSTEAGGWLFVAPEGKMQNDKASRWIHKLDDLDFILFIQG